MQDTQINTFTGGLDSDSDLRSVPDSRYIDATNVDTYSVENNSQKSISPLKGTTMAISPSGITTQVQITRVKFLSGTHTYSYSFYDGSLLKQDSFVVNNYTDFITTLASSLAGLGYYIIPYGSPFPFPEPAVAPINDYTYFSISRSATSAAPLRVNISWNVDGTEQETVVLQEAYLHSQGFNQIASYTIEDHLFTWSEADDEGVIELGVSIVTSPNNWLYTRLFRTWRWHFPIINPEAIDIRMESVSNEQWAMYVTDNYNKPKVFYIQKDYSEDCLVKYTTTSWATPTSGYLIYNYADEQTNLQLINNAGIVTFSEQLQTGGNLLSGGYRYSVRFGINGTDNTTEWSVLSPNSIPVFKTSTDAPSAYIRIQGDKSGEVTTKCNVLVIKNCMPNIFNYVELAAIYHAGLATNAVIVGKYSITESEVSITHTGGESGSQPLDYRLLPQTEPVIKTAKTLEIKKNRFNIANVSLGADEPELASIASACTISQTKEGLTQVGKIGSGDVLNVTAGITIPQVISFTDFIPYPFDTAPDLIFNNETRDRNNEYNPSTGVFTSATYSQIKISMHLSYTTPVDGYINLYLFKNNSLYEISRTIRIIAGTRVLPYDLMTAFTNTVMNFNGTPVDIGDTIKFKIWWQPDSVNPDDKLTLNPTGSSLNMGAYSNADGFELTSVGEYQVPFNCANKVGYMLNETYPFFMRFHYKNGYISSPYYIGSHTFSDESSGQLYNDYDGALTYSYGAVVSGLNLTNIKDRISGVSIWRGECNPTILGSGIYFNSDTFGLDYYTIGQYASIPNNNNDYAVNCGAIDNRRKFGLFFSHDTRINKTSYINGGYLKIYGAPKVFNNVNGITNGNKIASYAEYLGVQTAAYQSDNKTIIDAYYNDFATLAYVKLVNSVALGYKTNTSYTDGATGNLEGIGMTLNSFVTSDYGSDNGVYMAQYIRQLSGTQYDLTSINIVPTGTYLNISSINATYAPSITVFGGDTYTQKNIIKVRYWTNFGDNIIKSSFITYYAQNKINTQLFYCDESEDVAPTRNLQGWRNVNKYLFPFDTSEDVAEEQFNYDEGYSAQYPLPIKAYDSSVPSESKFVSRIYYSEQKPINSLQDFYRKIHALDFRDLDTKNGEIVALRDVNNYMVSVQPRAVSVLPYLSDVAIGTQGGGEILVGTGGVYNQRENIISTYGSTFQTCVYVGQNNNGNSQMYWFSPAFKKYCRYGADGIRILSDEQAMRTYFLGINSINKEYDMIQVYDPKYASQIMTFKNEASKYTLMYNEKANNFSTFITMNPLRYFQFNNLSMASYSNAVYQLFTGATLNFFGDAQEFNIKFVANKGVLNDKRFLSIALSVGTGYSFIDPTVSMSVSSHTAFPHIGTQAQKRWDNFFVAFAKAAGQQPIGQFAIIEVKTPAYIELMGAVTKWRGIFRGLFK